MIAPPTDRIRVEDIPVVRRVEEFDSFFRREYRAVLGLGVALSGSLFTAEELVQDAFLVTYREWERVGRLDNPGAWVRRVVANRAISGFRRRAAEARALLRFDRERRELSRPDLEESLVVWREVRRLPRRQAQAVALTYLHDLSRHDVAQILGCSEETVKTHLDRARRALASRLDDLREGPRGR